MSIRMCAGPEAVDPREHYGVEAAQHGYPPRGMPLSRARLKPVSKRNRRIYDDAP